MAGGCLTLLLHVCLSVLRQFCGRNLAFISGKQQWSQWFRCQHPGLQNNVRNCFVVKVKLTAECRVPQWSTGLRSIGGKPPPGLSELDSGVAGFEVRPQRTKNFPKDTCQNINNNHFQKIPECDFDIKGVQKVGGRISVIRERN